MAQKNMTKAQMFEAMQQMQAYIGRLEEKLAAAEAPAANNKTSGLVEWRKWNPKTQAYDGETIMVKEKDLPYLEGRRDAHLARLNRTPAQAKAAKKAAEAKEAAFKREWDKWTKSPERNALKGEARKEANRKKAAEIRAALK